jgi:hypothetical protein
VLKAETEIELEVYVPFFKFTLTLLFDHGPGAIDEKNFSIAIKGAGGLPYLQTLYVPCLFSAI